jgi:WD40 repeat protein
MIRSITTALRGRRLQFRLSTLLLVITAASVWLAYRFHYTPLSPENLDRVREVAELKEDVWEVAWSPDRRLAAFVRWEQPVEIRRASDLQPVRTFGRDKRIIHFAFSPQADVVAWCENNTRACITNEKTGRTIVLETGSSQPRVVFSPDGRLLATGGYGQTAKLWDVATGRLVRALPMGPTEGGLTPAFSPDGKTLAVGNRNAGTRLFDVASGKVLHTLLKRSSHGLAFHPTGETLAIAYVDGSIGVWDVAGGKLLHQRATAAEEIYRLDWSPRGDLLVSSGLGADICLWTSELKLLRKLPAPEWVISACFTPDGARLVTAGGDNTNRAERAVKVWGVSPAGVNLATAK